jgi:prepilin-type N-terminal cleavage/methylation domain-containing protein
MKPQQKGFSIIELLVVISVMGILLAIGSVSILELRDTSRARELQTQIAGDIERARQWARRYGVRYSIVMNPTTGSYTIQGEDAANVAITTVPSLTRSIAPNGEFLTGAGISNSVILTGPFGKLTAGALCFLISLKNTDRIAQINLVGVTANVITRAIRKGGTTCA